MTRIKNRARIRSEWCKPKIILIGVVCVLIGRASLFVEYETYVLEFAHSFDDATSNIPSTSSDTAVSTTKTTTSYPQNVVHQKNANHIYQAAETVFDYELGPATWTAKYFGFQNSKSNQGHNRSDWEALTTDKCDEQEEPHFLSETEIHKRKLPTAVLIGVQKGGTTALYSYLVQHPHIEKMEKELYVLDGAMDNYMLGLTTTNHSMSIPRKRGRELYSQYTLGIHQRWKRQNKEYNKQQDQKIGMKQEWKEPHESANEKSLRHNDDNSKKIAGRKKDTAGRKRTKPKSTMAEGENVYMKPPKGNLATLETEARRPDNPDEATRRMILRREMMHRRKIAVDMTPNYMLHSDRVPARLRCLVPWVKVFVMLRHPIDRARSQYDMKMRVVKGQNERANVTTALVNNWGRPVRSFDRFVRDDLEALYEVGVLQDWNKVNFEDFWKSDECWRAWQAYIHIGLNAPIGMGLYALQLKPFLDVLTELHAENAKDYFLAVDNQELRNNPHKAFQSVLQFLKLQPVQLGGYKVNINQAGGKKSTVKPTYELSNETVSMIQVAIEPYNHKLADMLGEEWRNKWSQYPL